MFVKQEICIFNLKYKTMKTFNILKFAFLIGCISFVACDKDEEEKGNGGVEPIEDVKKISSIESHSFRLDGIFEVETNGKVSFTWTNDFINVVEEDTVIRTNVETEEKYIDTYINCYYLAYGNDGKIKSVDCSVGEYSVVMQLEYQDGKLVKIIRDYRGEQNVEYVFTYEGKYITTVTDSSGETDYLSWKDGNCVSIERKGEYGNMRNFSYDDKRNPFSYESDPALAIVMHYIINVSATLSKNNQVYVATTYYNDPTLDFDNGACFYTYDNDDYPISVKWLLTNDTSKYIYK